MASWPRVLASYEGESSNLWGYRGIWFRGKERMPMKRTWKMQIYMLACVGMYVCIFMYSHAPKKNMEKEFSTVIFKRPRFIAFFDPPIFIHKLLFFYRILLSKLYPGIFHFFLIFFFFFCDNFPSNHVPQFGLKPWFTFVQRANKVYIPAQCRVFGYLYLIRRYTSRVTSISTHRVFLMIFDRRYRFCDLRNDMCCPSSKTKVWVSFQKLCFQPILSLQPSMRFLFVSPFHQPIILFRVKQSHAPKLFQFSSVAIRALI